MTARTYILLFLLALGIALGVAHFQPAPGYMDADYYYANGLRLAKGHGFTEAFLWNYLDDPDGLPHPSHTYWMPLASIVSATGMWVTRDLGFASAQWIFILISSLVPLITASLAFSLTSRRDLSLMAAFLAIFSGYYAPFLTTTDTFALYMLLGGSFFLAMKIPRLWLKALILGILAGLMHLSRTDGLMWLLIAALAIFFSNRNTSESPIPNSQLPTPKSLLSTLYSLLSLLTGYLLIMAPWLMRNFSVFGAPLAPGGDQMLWLTRYDEIFSYPVGSLTMESWLASGWSAILQARLWAFKWNLGTVLGVQGGIVLLPLIIFGAWQSRWDERMRLGIFAWVLTLFIMTIIFPFAGARGSFFHSGAAFQPLWWALAPIGLDKIIVWAARRRGWPLRQSLRIFRAGMVGMAILLTGAILWGRVISPSTREQAWGWGANRYQSIEKFISENGAPVDAAVIVSNPPGYFSVTERPALAVPDGDEQAVLAVAERYGGRYLILESGAVTQGLQSVFDAPEKWDRLEYLGELEGAKIFVIQNQ